MGMTASAFALRVVLTLGLVAAPLVASAQTAGRPTPRIGFIGNAGPQDRDRTLQAFREGLRELGWTEGQNAIIELRWAEGQAERYPALAAEMVRLKVDVIVLSGSPALRAAREATRTIPIVIAALLVDPVSAGFVTSLARPGGNVTGVTSQYEEIVTKQVQLLAEALPGLSRIALLRPPNPGTPASSIVRDAAVTAAAQMGLRAQVLEVKDVARLETAFTAAGRDGAQAVLVLPSPIFNAHRRALIALAASHRLPAFYELREYVLDGGLMSYGANLPEMYRRAASYVDRILKGAKPGELPIERATRFELVINLRTARALGLIIPQTLLQRADEVIE
jgi:ABC-type uncharacterized transport system substrate-binding protein